MRTLIWVLIIISSLSFILAFISALGRVAFLGVQPEGFSNASANLALIAIALLLASKNMNRSN